MKAVRFSRICLITLTLSIAAALGANSVWAAELLCYAGDPAGNPVKINSGYNVQGHFVKRALGVTFSKSFFIPDHDSYENLLAVCQGAIPQQPIGSMRISETLLSNADIFWPAVQTKQPFSHIISLGDSLSDSNNTLRYMAEMHKTIPGGNYWVWRFSNGPNWVDNLSSILKIPRVNLAYGGATSFDNGSQLNLLNGALPAFVDQVNFLAQFSKKDNAIKNAIPQTLFTVLIGANDFFFTDHTPEQVAANLTQGLNQLYNLGARYFLISNIPDLSVLPYYSDLTDEQKAEVRKKVDVYNLSVKQIADELKQRSGVHVYFYDLHATLDAMLNNQYPDFPQDLIAANCVSVFKRQPGDLEQICANPEKHIYWDEVHPTATAHCLMGHLVAKLFVQEKDFDPMSCVTAGFIASQG